MAPFFHHDRHTRALHTLLNPCTWFWLFGL
jgi:hypothetical protein